jgi:hypothetical protein
VAAGERRARSSCRSWRGLTAADAMTHAPHVAPEWRTVQALADGLDDTRRRDPALPRHRAFPRHGIRADADEGFAAPP